MHKYGSYILGFSLSYLNVHKYLYIHITRQSTVVKIKPRHAGGRPARNAWCTPVWPASHSPGQARCYKRYTQQVRRQSWRNPKGGILSTEVVFSICTFFLNFVFFLEGPGWRAGPFLTSVADTEPGPRVVSRVSTRNSMRFFFPLLGRGCVYERTGGCSWEEGLQKSSNIPGLWCRRQPWGAGCLAVLRGLPSSPSFWERAACRGQACFLGWQGWAHLFRMKLKLTI